MASMLLLFVPPLQADPPPEGGDAIPSVDWYYASAFGTGKYRAGERTVAALRIPVARDLDAPGDRDWTVRLVAPLTLGAVSYGFDDIIDQPLDSVSLATFTPGLEFRVRAGEHWNLRPFFALGGGMEFDGDDRAWIYSAGLAARRGLACRRWRCTLGLALNWAGYRSNRQGRDSMSSISAGLDFVAPKGPRWFDREFRPGLFVVYRNYLSDLGFIFDREGLEPLDGEWELGLSLTAMPGFSILGYRFERVGLSYRKAGTLRGMHIVSRFPF